MTNEQFKCKGKIPNGSIQFKSLKQILRNLKANLTLVKNLSHSQGITQNLSFKANLTLKVKVKVTSFQTNMKHLDARSSMKVKVKWFNQKFQFEDEHPV